MPNDTPATIPIVTEEANPLGKIEINNAVIAQIVQLCCREVPGVHEVGGGFSFSDLMGSKGVSVREDENETYVLKVRVIMNFGVEMGRTAQEIQKRVSDQVEIMTGKPVSKIDVIIEGIVMDKPSDGNDHPPEWSHHQGPPVTD
jgi:uncharacterized alkaline shock family protein YloU